MSKKVLHDSLPDQLGPGFAKTGYRLVIEDGVLVFNGSSHDSETQQEMTQHASVAMSAVMSAIKSLNAGNNEADLPNGTISKQADGQLFLRLQADSGTACFSVSSEQLVS